MQLWDQYRNTLFLMPQPLSRRLAFAIVTAHNPQGRMLSPAANQSRDSQLRLELEAAGIRHRSLWGCAPDFSHQEKSWAVLVTRPQALQLGNRLQQNALYWVEGDQLYLTPCLLQDQHEECLGLFSQRLLTEANSRWPKPR